MLDKTICLKELDFYPMLNAKVSPLMTMFKWGKGCISYI